MQMLWGVNMRNNTGKGKEKGKPLGSFNLGVRCMSVQPIKKERG